MTFGSAPVWLTDEKHYEKMIRKKKKKRTGITLLGMAVAVGSTLHHLNGLQSWAEKTNWAPVVLVCHIKEEQGKSLADGCTMSQACLSEATDAGT